MLPHQSLYDVRESIWPTSQNLGILGQDAVVSFTTEEYAWPQYWHYLCREIKYEDGVAPSDIMFI